MYDRQLYIILELLRCRFLTKVLIHLRNSLKIGKEQSQFLQVKIAVKLYKNFSTYS